MNEALGEVTEHTNKKLHITWPCEENVPVIHFSPNPGCTIEEKLLRFQSSQIRIQHTVVQRTTMQPEAPWEHQVTEKNQGLLACTLNHEQLFCQPGLAAELKSTSERHSSKETEELTGSWTSSSWFRQD